jgi:FAD:protein FMN transferase
MLHKLTIAVLICILFAACTPQNPYADRKKEQQFYVFGTLVGVTLWDTEEQLAEQAFATVVQELQKLHQKWHTWEDGSHIVALNQAIAAGQPYTVEDDLLLDMLQKAQKLAAASDYLFEPGIGKIIALWGFHQDEPQLASLPEAEQIQAILAHKPSIADLDINGRVVTSRNLQVQLDLGGFAKGYAVDLIMAKLAELGIENGIVNAGGDLKVLGRAGGRAWMIGIRHPQPTEKKAVIGAVEILGENSVVTSGDYERKLTIDGHSYSHVIDPRNGQPATGISSVTVIDESAANADAAATALMVAGLEEWPRIARQMGIRYVLIVDENGSVHLNPGMVDFTRFQRRDLPPAVISEPLE